ncbi:MAG TPA: hypothetical protein VF904_12295, partial [Anaeromyxobacteraceae bacterium]
DTAEAHRLGGTAGLASVRQFTRPGRVLRALRKKFCVSTRCVMTPTSRHGMNPLTNSHRSLIRVNSML